MYQVILYYKFSPIDQPDQFCEVHRAQCEALELHGRVYIAAEGINGTLAGTPDQILEYKKYLWSLPGFDTTEFKDDYSKDMPFVKLKVKTRPEIVSLKPPIPVDPSREQGKYLQPRQWRKLLEREKDYILLDVRNNYESKIGHFQGAITPDVENFYEFPQWLDKANLDKNKKVLMYCTGGIRCEKFSLLMEKKGFKDVYQLHGGIINYAQQEGGVHYRGKCFVFDDRLAVTVNKKEDEPLTHCEITKEPCDTYLNCANLDCNKLFICSKAGAKKWQGCCSEACSHAPRKRPFDPKDIFGPTRKWHVYREG